MEGFGPEKLIFILVVVMLLFGAKRLPEIGTSLGKGIREFKKSVREISIEEAPVAKYVVQQQAMQYQPMEIAAPLDERQQLITPRNQS